MAGNYNDLKMETAQRGAVPDSSPALKGQLLQEPVARNPRLNQLAAGFKSQDGTRFAIVSSEQFPGKGSAVQLVVIPANGQPSTYEAKVIENRVGAREGFKIVTGAGELHEMGGMGGEAQLHTTRGKIEMKGVYDLRLFRDIGVEQSSPSLSPR
jgi:hypothetical protein